MITHPICKALTTDITIAGGARTPVILNGTLATISILSLQSWQLGIFFTFTHFLIVYLTKKDQKFFDCFKNYIKYDEYYDS